MDGGNLSQILMLLGYIESNILGHAEREPVMDQRGALYKVSNKRFNQTKHISNFLTSSSSTISGEIQIFVPNSYFNKAIYGCVDRFLQTFCVLPSIATSYTSKTTLR